MKCTAFAGCAVCPDRAAMKLHDTLAQREPHPQPLHFAREPRVHAMEALEDAAEVIGGNPPAGVAHAHPKHRTPSMNRKDPAPSPRRPPDPPPHPPPPP